MTQKHNPYVRGSLAPMSPEQLNLMSGAKNQGAVGQKEKPMFEFLPQLHFDTPKRIKIATTF